MPNYTTVVQTASDLNLTKFAKNDTSRPFIRLKKIAKSFAIVQLMVKQRPSLRL